MSVLLFLPGLLVVLVKRHGLLGAAQHSAGIVVIQLLFGAPFLLTNPNAYLAGAFDLGRVFLYKWTVNWRFVPEDVFLSRAFAGALLAAHAGALLAFAASKWTRGDGGPQAILRRALARPRRSPALAAVTADRACDALQSAGLSEAHAYADVTTIMYTSNLIGVLFARSLHYQFYAWYAQTLPFLAWRTRLPLPLKFAPPVLSPPAAPLTCAAAGSRCSARSSTRGTCSRRRTCPPACSSPRTGSSSPASGSAARRARMRRIAHRSPPLRRAVLRRNACNGLATCGENCLRLAGRGICVVRAPPLARRRARKVASPLINSEACSGVSQVCRQPPSALEPWPRASGLPRYSRASIHRCSALTECDPCPAHRRCDGMH
jgi:hypothetical protein